MANPWEKYQAKPEPAKTTGEPAKAASPWEKYGGAPDAPEQSPDWVDKLKEYGGKAEQVLSRARGPVGLIANPAVRDVAARVIDYPMGILRTGAAQLYGAVTPGKNPVGAEDWKMAAVGAAPGVGDQAVKFGMPNPSVTIPGTNNKQINAQDAINFGGNALMNPAVAGKVISAVPGGRAALSASGRAAGSAAEWAAKKAGKIYANIPEETTGRYLENPDAINAAPARSAIADDLMARKDSASAKVLGKQDELSGVRQSLAESKADARAGLQDEKFQATNETKEAQRAFDEKRQSFKEGLQANNLTSMSGHAAKAIEELKGQVSKGSKDAYKILDNDTQAYSVRKAAPILNQIADEMNIQAYDMAPSATPGLIAPGQYGAPKAAASPPITAQTAGVQNEIRSFAQRLANTPQAVPARELKKMLQQIDNSEKAMYGQPGFDGRVSRAYKMVRGVIDDTIKEQNPEYAAKMQDVARKTALLDKSLELYGTPEKAIANLNGLTSQKGQAVHMPILQQISKETGYDLVSPAYSYLKDQKILKTPSLMERALEGADEAKALRAAKGRLNELSAPEYARGVADKATGPLLQKIGLLEDELAAARGQSEIFTGITPDSVTGKTKQLGGANNYGAEARFKTLDDALGTNFEQQIRARNDLDQFSKGDTQGSRKAVIGAATGAGIGGYVGGPTGAAVGGAIGGNLGAAADRYSGPMFKGALDAGRSTGNFVKTIGQDIVDPAAAPAAGGMITLSRTELKELLKAAKKDDDKGEKKKKGLVKKKKGLTEGLVAGDE